MQTQSMHFKARAGQRLADARLQKNLKKLSEKFVTARAAAIGELADFEGTRDAAVERRNRALERLDLWLETFERNARAKGAQVLYAQSAPDAARLIVEIAQSHGVRKVTKSKSMVSEEIQLNAAFSAAGVQPVETDLGEYILQINDNEAPSHIIAPVIHKDKEEISTLFAKVHASERKTEITELTREARDVLRSHFLSADMGVTGANFLIAETGSVALVTNEGNEGMCTIMPPKVHVVLTGIEKVLPTLEDLATLMRLLPRSATGQPISNYFSILTGPRRTADADGPEHMYYVLVDAGRTGLLGSDFQEMLRCIRCGACMNHCPGLSEDRWPCLWLGLSGSDGLGADSELCRTRERARPAACSDPVRPVQRGLPGKDSTARLAAQAAREAVGTPSSPVVRARSSESLGVRGDDSRTLCAGQPYRGARAEVDGRNGRAHSQPSGGRRLDRYTRLAGAERPHFPRPVSGTPRTAD